MGTIFCIIIVLIAVGIVVYLYTADSQRNKSCTEKTTGKIVKVDRSRQHILTAEYDYNGIQRKELSVSDSQSILKKINPRIHADGANGIQMSAGYRAIYNIEEDDVIGKKLAVFVNPKNPNVIHAELIEEQEK